MGRRKELLCFFDNEPIYVHLASILQAACPEAGIIYMSLRDRTAVGDIRAHPSVVNFSNDMFDLSRINFTGNSTLTVRIIYDYEDEESIASENDIGPAAGLLAAHRHDRTATWLVAACDYPLLTTATFLQLRQEASDGMACFQNRDGFCEPLLGIWTPCALRILKRNVQKGVLGPRAVVEQHHFRMVRPHDDQWLVNVNTTDEWWQAVELKRNE